MTRMFRIAAVLILAAAGACLGGPTDPDAVLKQSIPRSERLIEDLRYLSDEIGGRVTGTEACERSVDWAVGRFRDAGLDDVRAESFEMPATWVETFASAAVIEPESFPVRVAGMGYSAITPGGGITAPVVDIGAGSEADFARAGTAARGAILLLHSTILASLEDLFQEYLQLPDIIDRARAAGAVALVEASTRPRRLLYRHIASFGVPVDMPLAIVAREDAARIGRLLEKGRTVTLRLALDHLSQERFTARNAVADLPGRDAPEEIVLLGAHLDSWGMGTGALDNGCNVALVIEVARHLARLPEAPRRTVRFALFTGEEQGMWGSAGYVAAHRDEMDHHIAAVIVDLGSGRIEGFSLGGRDELRAGVEAALAPVADWGLDRITADAFVGTDNFDFLLEGVPNLVANQESDSYLPDYHAESDTFGKVDQEALRRNAAIVAVLVRRLADSAGPLGTRQSRDEVAALLAETGVDDQMRLFGIWEAWKAGERGRTD